MRLPLLWKNQIKDIVWISQVPEYNLQTCSMETNKTGIKFRKSYTLLTCSTPSSHAFFRQIIIELNYASKFG